MCALSEDAHFLTDQPSLCTLCSALKCKLRTITYAVDDSGQEKTTKTLNPAAIVRFTPTVTAEGKKREIIGDALDDDGEEETAEAQDFKSSRGRLLHSD